jgi:hypothetical protein
VIVTLEDTLTQAEHLLAGSGRGDEALDNRSGFQGAMRAGSHGRHRRAYWTHGRRDRQRRSHRPLSAAEIFVLDATLDRRPHSRLKAPPRRTPVRLTKESR